MWVVAATEAVVPPCFGGKSALCPVLSSFSRSCVVAAVAPGCCCCRRSSWVLRVLELQTPARTADRLRSRELFAQTQVLWLRVFVLLHFLCLFVSLFLTSPLPPLPLSSPSSSSSPIFTFSQHHHHQYYFYLIVIFRFFAFRFMFY